MSSHSMVTNESNNNENNDIFEDTILQERLNSNQALISFMDFDNVIKDIDNLSFRGLIYGSDENIESTTSEAAATTIETIIEQPIINNCVEEIKGFVYKLKTDELIPNDYKLFEIEKINQIKSTARGKLSQIEATFQISLLCSYVYHNLSSTSDSMIIDEIHTEVVTEEVVVDNIENESKPIVDPKLLQAIDYLSNMLTEKIQLIGELEESYQSWWTTKCDALLVLISGKV